MNDNMLLYNSRITKIYVEYLNKHNFNIDVDSLLSYAEMTKYQIEDPTHWFNQRQVDRFNEIVVAKTGNPNIAREAGRYGASSEALGAAKQYVLGLLNLSSFYLLIGKVYPIFSRAVEVKAQKLGAETIEIISTPRPDINEKLYQCENRIGMFESVAKLFTNTFAIVKHPICFHKGGKYCQYLITWEKTRSHFWKRIRNYALLIGTLISLGLYFILPIITWSFTFLFIAYVIMFLSFITANLEKKQSVKTIETQGNVAHELLEEMNIRHNNALLVHEIGQATSTILDNDKLINQVASIMEKRLNFNRGLILLANKEKTRLFYKAGYGYTKEQNILIKQSEFHLDNPASKGFFVLAFKEKKPFLINDITENTGRLSKKSLELAKRMGAHSIICVPIIYENESLGIISVDNIKSKRPHTQSDINLLMGVACPISCTNKAL
ncbi:GAF domain-containing protein, partial [Thermodesulfobacteriota bacterium]